MHSVDEISSLVPEGALVFFDLDDTLICYPSHLGSEPWFAEAQRVLPQREFDALCGLLANHLSVVPVEPGMVKLVQQLQTLHSVKVMTGREQTHSAVSEWEIKSAEQLASIGIALHVQHCGWGNKAEAIRKQVHTAGEKAAGEKVVVLVDDRWSECALLDQALGDRFVGIWYRAIEERRKRYDPQSAQEELETLAGECDHSDVVNVAVRLLAQWSPVMMGAL